MVNVVTIAACRRIYRLRLISLVQKSAATWRSVLHSSDELGELSQWQCTATMTAHKHCRGHYYYYYYTAHFSIQFSVTNKPKQSARLSTTLRFGILSFKIILIVKFLT